ncbi:FAD-dependent oxidoreductase [Amycolatopsis sp. NPDC006125]|uniref:FAD-dependent oxidoreductase n=1 Tax=Amycolatopsis sp. NPDC006125 TaxID=3156730 RepID=UPI0033B646B9
MTKALIVGGGISGLATAMVLSRQGIEVDLVERQPRVEALGSGITLIAPALRALDRLGVYADCVDQGYGVTDFEIYDVDGTLAERFPLPSPVGTDQPGLLGMMRPTLHTILIDHATKEGTVVRTGVAPVHIEQHRTAADVTFDNGERGHYDLVIGADGIRSTIRELLFEPLTPQPLGQGIFRVVLPRPAEVTAEVQFHPAGDVAMGFTPTAPDRMYMYCLFPIDDGYRPEKEEMVDVVRARIAPFGGVVAEIRDAIKDADQIHYTRFETVLVPDPWFRGRTVLLGDSAHCTTPHLAAGAAMCLEDAVVLGEELAAAATVDDALRAYCTRRFDRCKYVVETASLLSHWQTHPDTPGADHSRVMGEAFERLAGPF